MHFSLFEMETFLSEHGIKHRRVTPYWARANGLVENFNKTLKKAIQAACLAGKDWKIEIYKFLLTFRTTPSCATDKSPSSLHFQREVRTKLPSVDKGSAPRNLRETDARRKAIMKKYADRRLAKDYRRFRLGQKVLVLRRQPGKLDSKWEKDIFYCDRTIWSTVEIAKPTQSNFLQTCLSCKTLLSTGRAWYHVIHESDITNHLISDIWYVCSVRKVLTT